MSEYSRAIATARRERFWNIHDNVPADQLTEGCDYCESGWATGPGLVYRCDNCNPAKAGEPYNINIEPRPPAIKPKKPKSEESGLLFRIKALFSPKQ